jgi:hypothetical protein
MKKLLFILVWIVGSLSLYADTHYVDGAAINDNGDGTISSPKKYISSGIALMSGGDTLIIADGTYTGANNMIEHWSAASRPPNGNYGNDAQNGTSDDILYNNTS